MNICPLATTVALGFEPSNFEPSSQIVRACDSTRREVLGTFDIGLANRSGHISYFILGFEDPYIL